MKTVLITGCSSGYGLETARHFLAHGWNVIATMRKPRHDLFPATANLRVLPLDVTSQESIDQLFQAAGPIDVLVNNAGIGLFGAFEATPMHTVREVFETNTFGTMAVCRAAIPAFRERRAGTIVNVTSSVTLATFPLVAAYAASKAAVAGFTASLQLELKDFAVRVKLVEPGYGPSTRFAANGQQRMQGLIPPAYEPFAHRVFAGFNHLSAVTSAADVAEGVWQAANDATDQLHFPAGADAVALAQAR
ncbi:SDR family oxidoreductase [Tahibacter harae]|uniref:SDR family oxidoreductase n=1 Tax=Tahibacter harae TaxID=2963937 RepID=A0ABT1QWB5_9GAMM|nr:SDR family oxidoreductase [Tahibacter harae]MCQ4166573.1 SDR family oxidoreductase [Tahibacter harae]